VTLRNYDIAELRRQDVAHHLPAQTDYRLQRDAGGSRIITRADGCHIHDGDGNVLLDAMAGLWCVQVGYGREELAKAAYEQMCELPYYNTFFKTAAPPTVQLATKVSELMGGDLSHVFFNNSGSEAIDTVVRLARYYWQVKGEPQRTVFISRVNGYHGSTIAGASLGGMKHMHVQGGPWVPEIEQRILQVGPENVAAFIGEPIQGAGGVIIPPDGYWPRVEAICRKYGILLVCDEVICGFGRLGSWFGFQHFGVAPDLVSMAKGLSSGYLPISAVGVAGHIVEARREKGGDFVHGYTYSGHPTCAAVALKNIEIMEREDLVRRTREVAGPHLARGLAALADHPLVGEARSLGLLGAVEIVSRKGTNERFGGGPANAGPIVRDLCIENGLMIRAVRDTLVMSPPLVISEDEIDRMLGIIRQSLDQAQGVLREKFP
jgi:putrescine aminotransferase